MSDNVLSSGSRTREESWSQGDTCAAWANPSYSRPMVSPSSFAPRSISPYSYFSPSNAIDRTDGTDYRNFSGRMHGPQRLDIHLPPHCRSFGRDLARERLKRHAIACSCLLDDSS